jgi:hypothetical protein
MNEPPAGAAVDRRSLAGSARDARLAAVSALLAGDVWRGGAAASGNAAIPVAPSGCAALDARLSGGGWPAGALSEMFIDAHGVGEIGLALPLLARLTQAGKHIGLVAPPHLPYAPALARAGLLLARVTIVEPPTPVAAVWAAEQLLRTPACGAVLGWFGELREADLRRLQLAARDAGSVGLLYRPARAAGAPSLAALRLKLVRSDGRLWIEILRARGGRAGARFAIDEDEVMGPAATAIALSRSA